MSQDCVKPQLCGNVSRYLCAGVVGEFVRAAQNRGDLTSTDRSKAAPPLFWNKDFPYGL